LAGCQQALPPNPELERLFPLSHRLTSKSETQNSSKTF